MIEDYVILEVNWNENLAERVNEWINMGWEPQGGVYFVPGAGPSGKFMQAMLKRGSNVHVQETTS